MSQFMTSLKTHWKSLVILLLITLGGGAIIGFLTRSSMEFYNTLNRPAFAPPGWLFPIVWGILYTLMAIAIWLVMRAEASGRTRLLVLYFVQLAVNLLWPILFFIQQTLGLAFVWLMLLWVLIILLLTGCARISKVSAWLLTPYLLWTTFAAVLNFSIALMNP